MTGFQLLQQREKERLVQKIQTETHVGPKGEVRWNSNNRCVPMDVYRDAGLVAPAAQRECIDVDNTAAIAEYVAHREKNGYSDEEIFEMRAAFGENENIVDVFTGKKVNLRRGQ